MISNAGYPPVQRQCCLHYILFQWLGCPSHSPIVTLYITSAPGYTERIYGIQRLFVSSNKIEKRRGAPAFSHTLVKAMRRCTEQQWRDEMELHCRWESTLQAKYETRTNSASAGKKKCPKRKCPIEKRSFHRLRRRNFKTELHRPKNACTR